MTRAAFTDAVAAAARDTILWLQETPDAPVTGISREDEASVLAAWHGAPSTADGRTEAPR